MPAQRGSRFLGGPDRGARWLWEITAGGRHDGPDPEAHDDTDRDEAASASGQPLSDLWKGPTTQIHGSGTLRRSDSQAVKHWACRWYRSSPGAGPCRLNSISISGRSLATTSPQTGQITPLPRPPNLRFGARAGTIVNTERTDAPKRRARRDEAPAARPDPRARSGT